MKGKTRNTRSRRPRVRREYTARNIAQAAVTIAVGAAFAFATFLAGEAAARWSDAVKEDIKWSAGLTEDVRYLFTEEAPFAFEYAATIARADALAAAAEGRPPAEMGAAVLEAHSTRTTVEGRREGYLSTGDSLLSDQYWVEDHFDVESRLHDAREDASSTVVADPDAAKASGNRYAAAALAVSLLPIAIAVGYLGWLQRTRRRTVTGTGARAEQDVALIPDPAGASRGGVAGLALMAWLLLVILPPLQIYLSLAEDEASAESSAGAVQVMRTILVSNLAAGLEADLLHQADDFARRAEARAEAYSLLPEEATPGQAAIIDAELAVVDTYRSIAKATTPTVEPGPNMSHETVQEITADPEEWQQILARQNEAAEEAEHAGQRDNAMTVAVVLAGITTTLTVLAAANRRSRSVRVLAASSLAGAAGAALLGLLL